MNPPKIETVLVAVDGSDESAMASEYAIAVAERYDAELVVLYVHGRDLDAVMAGETEASNLSDTTEAFLDDVTEAAVSVDLPVRTASVYGFSPDRKLTHPGSVILDAAEELGADFLVIPRESYGNAPAEGILAKAAEYALLYTSQPVLAV